MTSAPPDPFLGTTLGGKYKLVERLGEGGMGAVYKAEHTLIKRTVAIKLLHSHAVVNEEKRRRFQKEAEVTSQISHPNAVTLHDFGVEQYPYIVMEYLEGKTLNKVMQDGPLSLERTCQIVKDVCGAIKAAHDLGIVHRDLKPDNVMLAKTSNGSEQVKVLDFGLSKIVREDYEQATLTQDGAIMGTPRYMSPEQARGQEPDKRSDIYCVALLAYEMLSGRPTFSAESSIELVQKQVVEKPQPLSELELTPPVSSSVSDVILKALEKNPNDRQVDIASFLAEFTAAIRDSSSDITLIDMPPALPPLPTRTKTRGEGKLTGAVLVIATVMVIIAAGTLIYNNLDQLFSSTTVVVDVVEQAKEDISASPDSKQNAIANQVATNVTDSIITTPAPTEVTSARQILETKEIPDQPVAASDDFSPPPTADIPKNTPVEEQTPPSPTIASIPKGWYIQAVDKLDINQAQEKQRLLRSNNIPTELEETSHKGRKVYNVLVGPFGSMISAQANNKDVQRVLGTSSPVTTIKPML